MTQPSLRTYLVCGALLAAGAIGSGFGCTPARTTEQSCPSARAVDGDTIACSDGTRLRLNGIDAAELPSTPGILAWQQLALLVDSRTLSYFPLKQDKYGRTVAEVFIGDFDISCVMLSHHQATYVPKWDERKYVSRCVIAGEHSGLNNDLTPAGAQS